MRWSLLRVAQPAHLLVPTLDCSASNRFRVSLPGELTAAIRREVYRTIFKVCPKQQQQQRKQQHRQQRQHSSTLHAPGTSTGPTTVEDYCSSTLSIPSRFCKKAMVLSRVSPLLIAAAASPGFELDLAWQPIPTNTQHLEHKVQRKLSPQAQHILYTKLQSEEFRAIGAGTLKKSLQTAMICSLA
jgi:hypothetical protein